MRRVTAVLAASISAAFLAAAMAGCDFGGADRVGGERGITPRVLIMLNPFASPQELTDFADEVARVSEGSLRIRIVPAGHARRPDFEAATIRDIRQGRGDLAMAGSRAWDEFGVRGLRALHAPLLIDSYGLQERVLTSDSASRMLQELLPLGLEGIGILPGPIRHPLGLRHPLRGPEDFAGLTIGVQQSRVADAVMRALGARPVRLPAEVPDAEGLDGVELRVGSIDADRLDIDGSHLMTNVNLWPRPLVLVAASASYRSLAVEHRQALHTAAENLVPKVSRLVQDGEDESAGNICRRGATAFESATPGQLRALAAAVEPVYRDLERDPRTRAAIQDIQRLKAQLAQPPSGLAACERAAEPPPMRASAIDGVWRMETDRRAARPEFFPENWGLWTFVFDRGKFAITQENSGVCTWGYGTFTADGNRMSWTFTDGGGIHHGASNKPGEYFVFGLSAYRDTLTLTPVEGEISPRNFLAEPWRRLSDAPSRRFLSNRCPPPAAALQR